MATNLDRDGLRRPATACDGRYRCDRGAATAATLRIRDRDGNGGNTTACLIIYFLTKTISKYKKTIDPTDELFSNILSR